MVNPYFASYHLDYPRRTNCICRKGAQKNRGQLDIPRSERDKNTLSCALVDVLRHVTISDAVDLGCLSERQFLQWRW